MSNSIKEKVGGALFGYAVGDALGRGTDYMNRREVSRRYPAGLSDYDQIIRDATRSGQRPGEWTNRTLCVCHLADIVADNNGKVNIDEFAKRLKDLYDEDPYGMPRQVRFVLTQPDWLENPFRAAERVWAKIGNPDSTNDPAGRAMVTGMTGSQIKQNAYDVCRLTHPTQRSRAVCTVVAEMANSIMWRDRVLTPDQVKEIASEISRDLLPFIDIAKEGHLDEFKLDDENDFWDVRKTLGPTLWALWHCKKADDALVSIVAQGGDAGVNASLAYAMTGMRDGLSQLGRHRIEGLAQNDRIQRLVERFTDMLLEKQKQL